MLSEESRNELKNFVVRAYPNQNALARMFIPVIIEEISKKPSLLRDFYFVLRDVLQREGLLKKPGDVKKPNAINSK